MADKTGIEWTEATWNPVVGCALVSPGCTNCYAMGQAARIERMAAGAGKATHYAGLTKIVKGKPVWTGEFRAAPDTILTQPLRWKRPRRIFVNSMSDLFGEGVPDELIDRVFAVMALCPQHVFQILTKRPERMRAYMHSVEAGRDARIASKATGFAMSDPALVRRMVDTIDTDWPVVSEGDPEFPDALRLRTPLLRNVWLGVSVEDQARADERIPHLLNTPAAVRFISAEPLLGPVDLTRVSGTAGYDPHWSMRQAGLDWVIVGGESGPGARPMHPDWARALRDQCAAAGVPFFFKQWGEWLPFGQSGFTSWRAHTTAKGNLWRAKGKWWGHADFNDGAGGRNTHSIGPIETVMVGTNGQQAIHVGKARAGRLLDGVEHNAMPEAR